jgi:hypothetical protein
VKYSHSGLQRETSLNINLNINNERQNGKIGLVWESILMGGGGGMKVIKVKIYG